MSATIGTHMNPNWFTTPTWISQNESGGKVGIAGVKRECAADLKKAVQAQQAQQRKINMEQAKQIENTPVKLTEEQLAYLRENYDPKNMDQEQYNSFVADLEKFGVLPKGDAAYVNAGSGLQLIPLESSCGTCAWGGLGTALQDYRGDALSWAKYRASFLTVDPETGKFYTGKQAALFGKIENVLSRI